MIGTGAFWQTLRRSVEKERTALVKNLISGACTDHAAYTRLTGRIESLDWIMAEASRIFGEDEAGGKRRQQQQEQQQEQQEEEDNL